jgi:hypothetical protein
MNRRVRKIFIEGAEKLCEPPVQFLGELFRS